MSFQLFVGGIGGPELMIVLFLVVLLFGANKLPKLARASGEAMGEFQKGRDNLEREIRDATTTTSSTDSDDAIDTDDVDSDDETSVTDSDGMVTDSDGMAVDGDDADVQMETERTDDSSSTVARSA